MTVMTKVTRLLERFKPSHYDISLETDVAKKTFRGTVSITGIPANQSASISLHSKDLKIEAAQVNGQDVSWQVDDDNDELLLTLATPLNDSQECQVYIKYSGNITETMHGIYPSTFKNESETKTIIGTQFESHHAREAFPCIDEPAAKATFNFELTCDKDHSVISNTPISSKKASNDKQTVAFETTPVMSTYLLAFVHGELETLEAKTKHGVRINTWATKDNIRHTSFALDVAVKTLDFYTDYFGIPYPLEKCDLIALPDFSSGAMENWGCITFREAALIVDPKHTPLSYKQWVALVVAHELAHQWFGNLVTMEWWTDLWLNEGFASWVEYLAVDALFPEWDMWTQFVTDDYLRAQRLDSLQNSHPIEIDIANPDEIRTIFDSITYSKGASVIRMLHAYLGAKDFQKGLGEYLKKYAYKNATTKDLWESLEQSSGKPVESFMSTWTNQTGFPFVFVTHTEEGFNMRQERYLVSGRDTNGALWPLPIDSTHTKEQFLLDEAEGSWLTRDHNIAKLNTEQTGFYMVRYDDAHFSRLLECFHDKSLSELDRLGLVNDTFQLAKSGRGDTLASLRLIAKSEQEDSSVVWEVMSGQLSSIRRVMDDDEITTAMRPYIRDITRVQLARLGWEESVDDSHFDKLLRPLILALASFAEEENVVKEALSRYDTANKPEDIHPDIRSVVYHTAVRHGDELTFNRLLGFYRATNSSQEKQLLASALTDFKQPELHQRALNLITSDTVKLQEVSYWIAYAFSNRHAKHSSWQWLQEHWGWLWDKFGSDIMSLSSVPKYVASAFADERFADEFMAFFSNVKTNGIERSVKQAHETILWQAEWRKRDRGPIKTYLNDYSSQ